MSSNSADVQEGKTIKLPWIHFHEVILIITTHTSDSEIHVVANLNDVTGKRTILHAGQLQLGSYRPTQSDWIWTDLIDRHWAIAWVVTYKHIAMKESSQMSDGPCPLYHCKNLEKSQISRPDDQHLWVFA